MLNIGPSEKELRTCEDFDARTKAQLEAPNFGPNSDTYLTIMC